MGDEAGAADVMIPAQSLFIGPSPRSSFLGVLGLLFDDRKADAAVLDQRARLCRPGLSYTCGCTVGVANWPPAASLAR